MKEPKPNEIWHHHSGRCYKILYIANTAHPSDKFPVTVVYQGIENGEIWARDMKAFTEDGKFTFPIAEKNT